MTMIFILGVVIGMLIMGFTIVAALTQKSSIERTINQTTSRLKTKGKIIEQSNPELEDWINQIKDNTV